MPAHINQIVHDVVTDMGGSISAEHGIGQYRVEELALRKSAQEMALSRRLKSALDPQDLMNPGKVFVSRENPQA